MASKAQVRRIVVVAVAVAIVAALAFLFRPRPTPVDVGQAVVGPIAETVQDQGQARVRDAYVVAAPVGGRLERTPLKVGDRVPPGGVVARIAPSAPALLDPSVRAQREALVAQAMAERDRAAAERLRTGQVLARTERLAASGFASRQSLDDARAAARQAASAARAAEATLTAARAALMDPQARGGAVVTVRSPSGGYVTRVPEPSERTIAAGTPLIEISDQHGLEAAIEFLSQDAVRIREGMAAEVYDWGGPGVLRASVRRIEPQGFTKISALGVEEQRAIVLLQFAEPPGSLGPGYRVWGRVFLRQTPNALKVPLGALQRSHGGWAVFRIEEGRARLRPVAVGAVTDREAEITRGLRAGDRLVVFPSDAVRDGVRVEPRQP